MNSCIVKRGGYTSPCETHVECEDEAIQSLGTRENTLLMADRLGVRAQSYPHLRVRGFHAASLRSYVMLPAVRSLQVPPTWSVAFRQTSN